MKLVSSIFGSHLEILVPGVLQLAVRWESNDSLAPADLEVMD